MKDKRNKWAQGGFTGTTEQLCHRDLRNTEDPGAVWGSGSTREVSHPYEELRGLGGQCPWERNNSVSKSDRFQDWTGKFNRREPEEDTRQLSTDTDSEGLFVGGERK